MHFGSMAKIDPKGPGLLPCRIHNFFRGLPGLCVCMDLDCSALAESERSGICSKMYSRPRERCECNAPNGGSPVNFAHSHHRPRR
jgi:hypothetical protein